MKIKVYFKPEGREEILLAPEGGYHFNSSALSHGVTVGRAGDIKISEWAEHVSQEHLIFRSFGWLLAARDVSLNGTLLNGEKMPPRRFIETDSGDEFQLPDGIRVKLE